MGEKEYNYESKAISVAIRAARAPFHLLLKIYFSAQSIGDVLHAMPVLRTVKLHRPQAKAFGRRNPLSPFWGCILTGREFFFLPQAVADVRGKLVRKLGHLRVDVAGAL